MDKHISNAATTDTVQRPSLYGDNSPQNKGEAAFSILRGLEPRRYKIALFRRSAWGASLLTLAAVVLVVGLNGGVQGFGSMPAAAASSSEKSQISVSPIPPVAAMSPETATKPEVATIVSESAPVEVEQNSETAPTSATVKDEKPDETDAGGTLTQQDAVPSKIAGDVASAAAGMKPAPERAEADAKKNSPKAVLTAAKPARLKSGNVVKDNDVDLIAALLAHVSSGTSAAQGKDAPRKNGNTVAAARVSSATAASRRERGPAPNRDIVTREPAESLESLVGRCRSLGFFEGELCRLRICSGMWGKDPACPASTPSSSSQG